MVYRDESRSEREELKELRRDIERHQQRARQLDARIKNLGELRPPIWKTAAVSIVAILIMCASLGFWMVPKRASVPAAEVEPLAHQILRLKAKIRQLEKRNARLVQKNWAVRNQAMQNRLRSKSRKRVCAIPR